MKDQRLQQLKAIGLIPLILILSVATIQIIAVSYCQDKVLGLCDGSAQDSHNISNHTNMPSWGQMPRV